MRAQEMTRACRRCVSNPETERRSAPCSREAFHRASRESGRSRFTMWLRVADSRSQERAFMESESPVSLRNSFPVSLREYEILNRNFRRRSSASRKRKWNCATGIESGIFQCGKMTGDVIQIFFGGIGRSTFAGCIEIAVL